MLKNKFEFFISSNLRNFNSYFQNPYILYNVKSLHWFVMSRKGIGNTENNLVLVLCNSRVVVKQTEPMAGGPASKDTQI